MPFEEDIQHTFEALTARVRDEVARQLADAAAALAAAASGDRADVVASARKVVEQEMKAAYAELERAAEAQGREAGHKDGYEAGRQSGLAEGREQGRQDGLAEGREQGRQDGLAEGREQGRKQGLTEGHEQGRQAGLIEGREQGYKDGRDEGRREGRAEGLEKGREERQTDGAAIVRLAEAVRSIDHAQSLSEILDAVAVSAGRETARAALLLVRGEQLRGWRFVGFPALQDDASRFELPLADGGMLADVVQTGKTKAADGSTARVPAFAKLPADRRALSMPITMSGQVVAVLYADSGVEGSPRDASAPALELLARHGSRCLEAVTAFRAARAFTERGDRANGGDGSLLVLKT